MAVDLTSLAVATAKRYSNPESAGMRLPAAPHASLAYGAAGVAYFLLRHASFGGGDASLEASARWLARAEADRGDARAFTTVDPPLNELPVESLLYHEPGLWWMGARLAAARQDQEGVGAAAVQFADATMEMATHTANRDVMFGKAGLLLGCAQLVESIDDPDAARPVEVAGVGLAADLAGLAERHGAPPGDHALDTLGPSHGWAGVAHALLRWSIATSSPPAPEALALLDRLRGLRRPSGRWPVRAGSREVWRGWCHGSAGWAQVWAQAWRATGDEQALALAVACADDGLAAVDDGPSLCCGRAGEGFAALTLFRVTGDDRWVVGAERALADAVRGLEDYREPPQRLFSGALGVALLASELEDPCRAAMPVFEAA